MRPSRTMTYIVGLACWASIAVPIISFCTGLFAEQPDEHSNNTTQPFFFHSDQDHTPPTSAAAVEEFESLFITLVLAQDIDVLSALQLSSFAGVTLTPRNAWILQQVDAGRMNNRYASCLIQCEHECPEGVCKLHLVNGQCACCCVDEQPPCYPGCSP